MVILNIVREHQEFNGKKYYKANDGYYKSSRCFGAKCMHRDVFEYYNGSIEKGNDIHHIDGDKSNNNILNLESCTRKDHKNKHDNHGIAILDTETRSLISKKGWENRIPSIRVCLSCNNNYETISTYSKFCSKKCRRKFTGQ